MTCSASKARRRKGSGLPPLTCAAVSFQPPRTRRLGEPLEGLRASVPRRAKNAHGGTGPFGPLLQERPRQPFQRTRVRDQRQRVSCCRKNCPGCRRHAGLHSSGSGHDKPLDQRRPEPKASAPRNRPARARSPDLHVSALPSSVAWREQGP